MQTVERPPAILVIAHDHACGIWPFGLCDCRPEQVVLSVADGKQPGRVAPFWTERLKLMRRGLRTAPRSE